jgi:DNA-binding Xre family transcriptional regulator
VTISCKLRLLLARVNVERAKQGNAPLSLRCLAKESGVSLSVLTALNTGKSQRIDYGTIDHLLNYFSAYFAVTTNDLLVWEQAGDIGNMGNRGNRRDSEQPMSVGSQEKGA